MTRLVREKRPGFPVSLVNEQESGHVEGPSHGTSLPASSASVDSSPPAYSLCYFSTLKSSFSAYKSQYRNVHGDALVTNTSMPSNSCYHYASEPLSELPKM